METNRYIKVGYQKADIYLFCLKLIRADSTKNSILSKDPALKRSLM